MKSNVVATGLLASSCLIAMQANGVERDGAVENAWIGGKLEAGELAKRIDGVVDSLRRTN